MSSLSQKLRMHDTEVEQDIVEYVRSRPSTKQTIRCKEVAEEVGLAYRIASETMEVLSHRSETPIGEKMDLRMARWRINRE